MARFLLVSLPFVICVSHPFIQPESRIVNGVASPVSSYPFIAAIRDIEIDDKGHSSISEAWCGGSLIRKTYPAAILTAGHCVSATTNQLLVELNATNTQQPPIEGISSWRVIYIATHEEFDSYTLNNDIAILFIDVDLSERNDLSTATIPSTATCCTNGDALEIIGYGRISLGGSYSKTLEHTNLQYLDKNQCNRRLCLWETRSANCKFSYANEKNICGLGDQTTPCHGDSGSPLVIKGSTEQVGVVSWGIDCVATIPTIFTNTAMYDTWISGKLNLYLGRSSLTANVPPLQPIHTPKVTEEAVPLIIHHMFTTADVSKQPTVEPTQDPTNAPSMEPTFHPFSDPTLVVPAPTAMSTAETTEWINESDHGVIFRLRSIIVTGLGFSVILCALVSTALCCKERRIEDEEYNLDDFDNKAMSGNPYIIPV